MWIEHNSRNRRVSISVLTDVSGRSARISSVLGLVQVAVEQLGVGVVRVQFLLLLQLLPPPFVFLVHAEQGHEQAKQEAGYATGDQYPRVPRLLRLDLQPQDFRAPFVQFHRSVRELLPRALPLRPLLAAIVHRPRDDFTRVQPRVERVALAAARVELDRILGEIEFLQGAKGGQIFR